MSGSVVHRFVFRPWAPFGWPQARGRAIAVSIETSLTRQDGAMRPFPPSVKKIVSGGTRLQGRGEPVCHLRPDSPKRPLPESLLSGGHRGGNGRSPRGVLTGLPGAASSLPGTGPELGPSSARANVDPLFVHKDLHGCPVRPDSEFEHQVVGRATVHTDQLALVEQFQVMRRAQKRKIPLVIGSAL